jgi:hypothetical protein
MTSSRTATSIYLAAWIGLRVLGTKEGCFKTLKEYYGIFLAGLGLIVTVNEPFKNFAVLDVLCTLHCMENRQTVATLGWPHRNWRP